MVARFEPLWVSYWQGGGMMLKDGSTATVSGTSYTSCSANVSGCTLGSTDCIQPDHVAHVKVWAMAAHTSTHSSIFSSPPLTHTPHTHPWHVAVRARSVPLLVTVVHLFDPLISLHDQSIRHGTHAWWWPGISCHHDHQHLWLWIMDFRVYVSEMGREYTIHTT